MTESFNQTDLKDYVKEVFLDTEGTILCEIEQPIQNIQIEVGELKCIKCRYDTKDQYEFVHHLIQCYEGPQALTRFRKYNLYSKRIQEIQSEAKSKQEKNLIVPIKGLPSHGLEVPYKSRLARLFAAGAELSNTPEMGDKSCYMGAGGYTAPSATVNAGSNYAREDYAYGGSSSGGGSTNNQSGGSSTPGVTKPRMDQSCYMGPN